MTNSWFSLKHYFFWYKNRNVRKEGMGKKLSFSMDREIKDIYPGLPILLRGKLWFRKDK